MSKTTSEIMEKVMIRANELCQDENNITTFSSTHTGQQFAVLTLEQLNLITNSKFK